MKIKPIHAFAIKGAMAGGKAATPSRRASWLDSAAVAGPMSRFAFYKWPKSTAQISAA